MYKIKVHGKKIIIKSNYIGEVGGGTIYIRRVSKIINRKDYIGSGYIWKGNIREKETI